MADGISIAERNPRYWSYDGEPTLLLGGSVEDNLFQVSDVEAHLDDLGEVGGNYVRCTMSCRDEGNVQPFADDGGTYDLARWNDEYWDRFERFLAATGDRDIVVQIELWDCWDLVADPWAESAWNPANNDTYTAAESGLPESVPDREDRFENPFLSTPPALDDNRVVRPHQERFVDRVLDATERYDHVLYAVGNETETDPAWGEYWAGFVREREPDAHVTEMWNAWELRHPDHFHTIENPAIYDFLDVSQNNFQDGREHWSALQACRVRVTDPVRPFNNVKIYGSDAMADEEGGEIFGGSRDGVERFWRTVFGGCASARFHRPPFGLGLSEPARTAIEGARAVTDELDLFACDPHNELLAGWRHNVASGAHPDADDGAYVLANPGEEYAVYLPYGSAATLGADLVGLECRWFDADAAEWETTEPAVDGRLDPPGDGQWIAVVQ